MKRRFATALQAVAVAALGASVSAMAPVIDDVPSPIIADETPVSGGNHFVYPDALDLDALASDDTVANNEIIWSYFGSGRYQINGQDPLDPGTEDPVNPGASKRIDNTDNDPDSVDANTRTITFRDADLSPIGGPDAAEPASTGIIHSEVVTLFASDGTTHSSADFLVYTENDGVDRLSSSGPQPENELTLDFAGGAGTDWISNTLIGTLTFTRGASAGGLAIQVPAAGNHFGSWISPYDIVTLGQNKVYRVRLSVDTATDLAVGTTPLWSFTIDNFNTNDPNQADNRFSGDLLVLDNEGGANSAGLASGGRNNFEMWYTPAPVTAPSWNDASTGIFTPTRDSQGKNGMRFQFRVIDVEGPTLGQNDAGTIVLEDLAVDSFDINDLTTSQTIYEDNDLVSSDFIVSPLLSQTNTQTTFSGGDLTVQPDPGNTDAWDLEVVSIDPGDANNSLGDPSSLPDNWPLTWQSDELWMSTTSVIAPSATAETNPPDALGFAFDTATTEMSMQSNVLATVDTLGMPKTGTTTEYKAMVYTHSVSNTAVTNATALRPRVLIVAAPAIQQGGNVDNLGGITITGVKVEVVDQP